ncbi:MAG: sigma-70 family RNA polymerase sigma factor [Ardenticatenaceae bacterium]|nr:sigma-70 family RNA polymerase sigma factor [Anaerolineales bacterium]MCB8921366.1 sigma-70 family RNA polymerase sigma factor [Ardenticatenaceae bacterium]MCB8991488.1 sigma-70 family RNA polymerase sigma factor [Ardenticatenaceae bacterium]MCB9004010.1 sigma-70 family RNA polymerase sigma factor [Ardenticatenaceae bacterium]
MTALSDNALLEQARLGDDASFDTLFYRHYDRVYGLLFRLAGSRAEAEDLTQEVFLKLHQHAFTHKRFSPQREHNLSAWLYRVATNMGYNAIRSRQRRWQRNTMLVPDPQGSPAAEVEAERRETETAVRQALAQLPKRQVQLLLMRQMGFSYAECAAVCGVAPGSVGTLLARAAKAFRKAYKEKT